MYVSRVQGNQVYCLDREARVRVITIDPTEYKFKLALCSEDYGTVMRIIQTSNLVGQSIIGYLQKKGYPQVALQFVKDPMTRFELAIECGNIDVAVEVAKGLDTNACWERLGKEALAQGNYGVLEMTYQRRKEFDKLSFLYLAQGNSEKLGKMGKIAEMRGDYGARMQTSLFMGDVGEQVKIFKEVGQLPLAWLAAKSHGMEDEARALLEMAGRIEEPLIKGGGELLKAPRPIFKGMGNWPLKEGAKGFTDGVFTSTVSPKKAVEAVVPDADAGWGAEEADVDDLMLDEGDGGWDLDADLDIPADELALVEAEGDGYLVPSMGVGVGAEWCRNSSLAWDHAAAGEFDSAMQLLNRQVGIINFAPLKKLFLAAYAGSRSYLVANGGMGSLSVPLMRGCGEVVLPNRGIGMKRLVDKLQEGYSLTTVGKFADALVIFRSVLQSVVMVVVDQGEEGEVKELVGVCREYITGLRMEIGRKELGPDEKKRSGELSVYFTRCGLQKGHVIRTLQSAMVLMFKMKNFGVCVGLARRLLDMEPPAGTIAQARKFLTLSERTPTDEVNLEFEEREEFRICSGGFVPMYRGSKAVECGFCGAVYEAGKGWERGLCACCEIGAVGGSGTGLRSV